MRKGSKLIALVLVLLMAVSFLGACGGGGDASTAKPASTAGGGGDTSTAGGGNVAGGTSIADLSIGAVDTSKEYEETVYFANSGDLETADPFGSTSATVRAFTNNTTRTLTYNNYITKQLDYVLATSVEDIAGDNTLFEVKLREGVKFHNGADFTSEDVKFTWDYAKDVANVIQVIPNADKMVKECKIVDDYTVQFELNYAIPDFPTQLEIKMYNKKAFDELPKEEACLVGCGPYMFKEHRKGIDWTAERFDDFYGGSENYPTKYIVTKSIPEFSSIIAAIESGDVDCTFSVTASQVPLVEASNKMVLEKRLGTQPWLLSFNYRIDKWYDLELKKALAHAINRDDIVEIALNGGVGGEAHNQYCPPTGFGYVEVETYEYDPEEAKRIIDENGYAGERVKIACYALGKPLAEVLQAQFSAVGLNSSVEEFPGGDYATYRRNSDFDILVEFNGYVGSLLYNFERNYQKEGTSNLTGYYDEEFETLLASAQTAPTYDDMLAEFAILQEWCVINLPVIVTHVDYMLGVRANYVEGFVVGVNNNAHEWFGVRIPKGARTGAA